MTATWLHVARKYSVKLIAIVSPFVEPLPVCMLRKIKASVRQRYTLRHLVHALAGSVAYFRDGLKEQRPQTKPAEVYHSFHVREQNYLFLLALITWLN